MPQFSETDPRHHTQKIQSKLTDLIEHLREDVRQVEEPQARALFETSAEVLSGLRTAYQHYEQQSEAAWQRDAA